MAYKQEKFHSEFWRLGGSRCVCFCVLGCLCVCEFCEHLALVCRLLASPCVFTRFRSRGRGLPSTTRFLVPPLSFSFAIAHCMCDLSSPTRSNPRLKWKQSVNQGGPLLPFTGNFFFYSETLSSFFKIYLYLLIFIQFFDILSFRICLPMHLWETNLLTAS